MRTHPNTETEELADNPLTQITSFQRDLLVALSQIGPCCGLTIKSRLEEDGYGEVNHGRLYPSLDKLDRYGFVQKERKAEDKRSNSYELTNHGLSALAQYRDWISGGRADD